MKARNNNNKPQRWLGRRIESQQNVTSPGDEFQEGPDRLGQREVSKNSVPTGTRHHQEKLINYVEKKGKGPT